MITGRRKPKGQRKTCLSVTFTTTNPTWTAVCLEAASNHLTCSMASYLILTEMSRDKNEPCRNSAESIWLLIWPSDFKMSCDSTNENANWERQNEFINIASVHWSLYSWFGICLFQPTVWAVRSSRKIYRCFHTSWSVWSRGFITRPTFCQERKVKFWFIDLCIITYS